MAFTVPDRIDDRIKPVAKIKGWSKVTTIERGMDRLIATDPELADLRPVSVQIPVKSTSTDAAPVPVNTGTAA